MSVTTIHTKDTKRELPPDWRWVRLGDVCESRTGIRNPNATPDVPFQYVDIASVDNARKRIADVQTIQGKDAPSRARQVICTNDVLVATTRPNLNAVAKVPHELDNQICSTGFCVLRANQYADSDYLFSFVRHANFINSLTDLVKGALYPAVNDSQVLSQPIPLPPLAEQQRITGILKEQMAAVDKARAAAEARMAAVKVLPAAFLRQVFPRREQKLHTGWKWIKLDDVCKFVGGGTPSKQNKALWSGSIPWISAKDMKADTLTDSSDHISEEAIKRSSTNLVPADTVLVLQRGMGLAKGLPTCLLACPCTFNQDIRALVPSDQVTGEFIALAIRSYAREILGHCDTVTHGTLKLDTSVLRLWPIPIPNLNEQRRVADMLREQITAAETARAAAEAELAAINALPATLLRRAFNGEL